MSSLDDVLSEKPAEKTTEAPAPAPETKVEAPAEARAEPDKGAAADGQPKPTSTRREHQKKEWEAQGRDPATGQFVAKPKEDAPKEAPKEAPKVEAPKVEAKPADPPKTPQAAPQQEMTEKERAAFQAVADERRKRQALEQELAQLRQGAQKPAAPAEPAKTFWDDPDGALKSNQQLVQEVAVRTRLDTTEAIARSRYADFDEKIETFKTLLHGNPALAQQWLQQRDPAEFAYRVSKNHLELQQVGGLDAMRKKIEDETTARVRAEVEAEHKKKEEEAARQRAAIPPSLSDVRGASTQRSAPAWGGPTPLSDVLTGKG